MSKSVGLAALSRQPGMACYMPPTATFETDKGAKEQRCTPEILVKEPILKRCPLAQTGSEQRWELHYTTLAGKDKLFNDAQAVPEQMDLDTQAGGTPGGILEVPAVEGDQELPFAVPDAVPAAKVWEDLMNCSDPKGITQEIVCAALDCFTPEESKDANHH
eukprot:1638218-Rhodomonas_salina.1